MSAKDFDNIYLTGDTHADFRDLLNKAVKYRFSDKDLLIILGDVGINFWGNERDHINKYYLSAVRCTVLCIHGNHEMRPTSPEIAYKYKKITWMGDSAYVEDDFPTLIMADEGARYHINDRDFLVIGGAYSVDKPYRLKMGFGWFPDEQLSDEEKDMIRKKVADHGNREDIRKNLKMSLLISLSRSPVPIHIWSMCIKTVPQAGIMMIFIMILKN